MDSTDELLTQRTRRAFLGHSTLGLGAMALGSLLNGQAAKRNAIDGLNDLPHFAPKAKRVIYLFQSGGPSQLDLFDPKPTLIEKHGTELPEEIRRGQRLTAMSGNQASLPLVGSPFKFAPRGQGGVEISDTLPHISGIADDLCLIRSMHTEAINHGPGVTHMQTGSQFPGRPSIGAWLNYGLGLENDNLPSFVVMVTKGKGGQPLVSRLWGSGFLPSENQGIRFRSGANPVLHLQNPSGIGRDSRRLMLDRLRELHELQLKGNPDAEIESRISQYEMAFRMQSSVPDLMDITKESKSVTDLYGPDAQRPGSFARNCILARRMAERGVPFIHLFHRGWDHHGGLPGKFPKQCKDIDQPAAALIKDLKQRGMLDETLVICGGEFGRTIYSQGKLTKTNHGRDHHSRCFTTWVAGGGFKAGYEHGQTDDHSYNIVKDPVHINDLNATLLQQMGIDHERLTYRFLGLDQRLTGVEGAKVIPQLVA